MIGTIEQSACVLLQKSTIRAYVFLQVCPFHHGKKYREAGTGGRGEASLYHARLLCQLWRKVEVAASEAAADQEDNMCIT